MARKKTAGMLAEGTRVRVRDGVTVPEFPDVSCAGWTGAVVDMAGKKDAPQYVIEWDARTIAAMPSGYQEQCEKQNLLSTMVCLPPDTIEPCE